LSVGSKKCFPGCELFRCEQRTLVFRGKTSYCRFADDECIPQSCKYTKCVKGRFLPNGTCGLNMKTRELDIRPDECVDPMEIPSNLAQKMKNRRPY
jgi:hypothetical protein